MKTSLLLISAAALATSLALSSFAGENSIVTAVYGSVHNGYHRTKLPDGSFKPEYYALGNGQYLPGESRDTSIDEVSFPSIARMVGAYLGRKNYHLAKDSKSADFLLVVSWGTTVPFNDNGAYRTGLDGMLNALNMRNTSTATAKAAAAAGIFRNGDGTPTVESAMQHAAEDEFEGQLLQMKALEDMRRQANEHNARLLGYVAEINYRDTPARFGGTGAAYQDLFDDIENERYFVVISAYDFKAAKESGKRRLLWATRVSIQVQGNRFDRSVATMVAKASKYFGENSGRLVRQYDDSSVSLGETKFLDYDPAPASATRKK